MATNHESGAGQGSNPNADAWDSLSNEPRKRGKLVKGPNGKLIPEEEYDAAMEAYEREQFYENNPEARDHDALMEHLAKMDANPDRLEKFEGEHARGSSTRDSEYTTLNSGEKGMYGGSINNAKRKEMARMMHDAEDLQTFEEDARYAAYIARERAKIGTVYKTRDEFNHKIVARLKRLDQSKGTPALQPEDEPEQPDNPEKPDKPETPQLPGPKPGEILQITGPTKIEIGDIDIKVVEKSIEEFKEDDLAQAERRLKELQPKIGESYAKNRRLLVGRNNRAEFAEIKSEYGEILDQYLRLRGKKAYKESMRKKSAELEKKLDDKIAEIRKQLEEFSKSEIGGPYETQEEVDAERERLVKKASDEIQAWYDKEIKALETSVNADFVKEFIEQETQLEKATTDALDNGSICRKFVSKVLNNKVLKGALVAAGVAGMVVTGGMLAAGVAAGTMSLGFGLTASGAALGAVKGGLSGFLMSRQDSKVSKVRGFASEEDIKAQLGEIDITSQNADVSNVTKWLMGEYGKANTEDRSSNRKRTAVSAGIGAVLGALASGLHFDKTIQQSQTSTQITGYQPVSYKAQYSGNIDVSPNHGYLQIFDQVQGDPAKWDQAFQITQQVAQKYGVVSDMGKGVLSPTGVPELLPGKPSTWDATSQQFLNDILNEWASKGCIPRVMTGGNPIWGPVTNAVPTVIKNSFMQYLARGTALATAGAIGGRIGGAGRTDVEGGGTNQPEGSTEGTTEGTTDGGGYGPEGGNPAPEGAPEEDNPTPTETPTETPAEAEPTPEGESPAPEGESPAQGETPEGAPEAAGTNPESNPAESLIPGFESLSEAEKSEVQNLGDLYGRAREVNPNATDENLRLAIINRLGRRLGYQGFEATGRSGQEVQESFSNLPDEQRNRLETLYRMVLQQVAVNSLRKGGFSDEVIKQTLGNS